MNEHHGMSNTPEYRTWVAMNRRCSDPHNVGFKHYGGRGIAVCDRWRDSFISFYTDMGARPDGMSLDRIDVNGNYEPDNCRWASPKQQGLNRRNTINPNDEPMTLLQVRVSEAEKATIIALADKYDVTISGFVRLVIEYAKVNLPTIGRPSRKEFQP
jgi:hypothetical protein